MADGIETNKNSTFRNLLARGIMVGGAMITGFSLAAAGTSLFMGLALDGVSNQSSNPNSSTPALAYYFFGAAAVLSFTAIGSIPLSLYMTMKSRRNY